MNKQMRQEISVDLFAGGGGASTGYELATGKHITIAINHNRSAILMHQTNHPYTEHYQADVFEVDPKEATRGRPVGFLWASPDCRHFSKAKGAPLVDRKIRGLAWIILRWALDVRPRVIMAENVEEIQTWGPLIPVYDATGHVKGYAPDPERKGETFDAFIGMLTHGVPADCPALDEACEFLKIGRHSDTTKRLIDGLGYDLQYRELIGADYGAPTTRKRWVMVARCDGNPIIWPKRTHAPRDSEDVRSGALKPWRSAAEIIDWSLPCPSIFATKGEIWAAYGLKAVRPLADNTLRRIIRGVDKFTIRSGRPFIVPIGYGERQGQAPRVHSIDAPLPTVVSTTKHDVCDPLICPVTFANTCNSVGAPADQPIYTVRTGGGGGQLMSAAQLIQYHTEQNEGVRAAGLTTPINTLDTSNRYGLATAQLAEYFGNAQGGLDITEPCHTITVGGNCEGLMLAHVAEFKGQDIGQAAHDPLRTITAGGGEFAAVQTTVAQYDAQTDLRHWPEVRALLNRFCGYSLSEDEVLLISLYGVWYYIADIGLRMLSPRELYNAMGFPPDYCIEKDYRGHPYTKGAQVARCGNAVCPPMAEAVIRANYQATFVYFSNMAQLQRMIVANMRAAALDRGG